MTVRCINCGFSCRKYGKTSAGKQRCIFHAFCQVRKYTTRRPKLRNHRGMSIERRIKAVCWWCYKHSPQPLSATEILTIMPTDRSISKIYNSMSEQAQLKGVIPTWGDAIAWSDLHNYDKLPFNTWD